MVSRAAADNIQWFESVSYAYQIGATRRSRSACGGWSAIRRFPTAAATAWALLEHLASPTICCRARSEIYLAYGNPNALMTVPQAIFKIIFYAGAEKGT